MQDIPIELETARIEEMEMCKVTIVSQHDHIVTLEREHEQFRAEIAKLTVAQDAAIAQA